MGDLFKGFLLLRLLGLIALLIVVAVVLGIWSLTRGSDAAGIGTLAGALIFAVAIGALVARRLSGRSR
ncbi:MAG: hypothetical protein ACLP8S_25300 [Solirubrobacteraceae bacterium]